MKKNKIQSLDFMYLAPVFTFACLNSKKKNTFSIPSLARTFPNSFSLKERILKYKMVLAGK